MSIRINGYTSSITRLKLLMPHSLGWEWGMLAVDEVVFVFNPNKLLRIKKLLCHNDEGL